MMIGIKDSGIADELNASRTIWGDNVELLET